MSVQFVSVDREALREWEAAQKHAEACRQDWIRAVHGEAIPTHELVQAAYNYAEAANKAAEAAERYEAIAIDTIETERLRERLEELAI